MDAVILAGGRCTEDVKQATNCEFRAELPIAGRPMAAIVAESILASKKSDRVVMVGYKLPETEYADAGANFVSSLKNGLDMVKTEQFLLCASDLPFLKPNSLDEFMANCLPNAAINYPIIPIGICESQFPGMKRTKLRLREGTFTGGNVAVCNTELMRKSFPVIEKAYDNRKKPLKLASQVGFTTLLRVSLGQMWAYTLPLHVLERRVARFLGAEVKAVATSNAEIGADIDSLTQYRQAVKMLESLGKP